MAGSPGKVTHLPSRLPNTMATLDDITWVQEEVMVREAIDCRRWQVFFYNFLNPYDQAPPDEQAWRLLRLQGAAAKLRKEWERPHPISLPVPIP